MLRALLSIVLCLACLASALAGRAKPLTVKMTIDSGCVVYLSDGSTWEVRPENRIRSMKWSPNIKVAVYKVDDRDFPYRLIVHPGQPQGEVVAVKRLIRYR